MTSQELKSSILQIAIQGKLVPQNSEDETAFILFAKINKKANTYTVKVDDIPFDIPESWTWVRLGQIANINGGYAFKSSDYTENGIRVIRISDFDESGFKHNKVVRHPFNEKFEQFNLEYKNILIAMTGGTVGKSLIVNKLPEKCFVNQRVATIKVNPLINPDYVNLLIQAPLTQQVVNEKKNSTNDNISMEDIKGFLFPLPPYGEQKRIVEKIEEILKFYEKLNKL